MGVHTTRIGAEPDAEPCVPPVEFFEQLHTAAAFVGVVALLVAVVGAVVLWRQREDWERGQTGWWFTGGGVLVAFGCLVVWAVSQPC